MVVMSTVSESCAFLDGVGGCTIFGEPSQGSPSQPPTSNASPSPPLPMAPTPTSSASSLSRQSASPSPTLPSPSSTVPPSTTSPTAVAPPNSPNAPPNPSNGSSPPVTPNEGTAGTDITNTRSDTNTLATGSLSTSPSTPSPSSSTSPVPLLPTPSPSTSHLPASAIAAIIGGILLVLLSGLVWYAMRRSHQASPVAISSAALGSSASLSETALLSATPHAPLSIEDEGEKLEDNAQNSFTRPDTRRGSAVARVSNLVPITRRRERNPLSRFLETVPFLSAPSMSAKAAREAERTRRRTMAAHSPSPWSAEATEGSRQSAAEIGHGTLGQREIWEDDGHQCAEGGSGNRGGGRGFRYETDGGICLDGGPLERPRYAADDDQRTSVATVATLPPPYSQY